MKKFIKVIGLMSMAAMFAVSTSSCKKTEENAEFTVTLGQMHEDPSNRAYIDLDGNFFWNDGDKIMVYNLASNGNSIAREYTAVPGSNDLPSTKFKGRPVGAKKDLGFRYFYPAGKASGQLVNNVETFTVDSIQYYNLTYKADKNALVMAQKVTNLSEAVWMDHIFGILNLRINTTRTDAPCVKEIIVEDNFFNLHGNLSLNLGAIENANRFNELLGLLENNNPTYAAEMATYLQSIGYYENNNGAGKTMKLDCSACFDGDHYGALLTRNTQQRFRIVLRPGALYRGFTVTIKFMDPSIPPHVETYPADVANVIKPAWFTTFDITVD